MQDNNDNEISGLDDFFDDDPTDELPILNLQDIDPDLAAQFDEAPSDDTGEWERPVFPDPAAPESVSEAAQANPVLRQMELEIQALQSKWHEIEDDVRSRDEFIENLEAELRTERASFDDLKAELDTANAALAEANEECARLASENARHIDAADIQQSRMQDAQTQLVEQEEADARLREELNESKNELARVVAASSKLAADHRDQQKAAQELTDRLCAANEELHEQTTRADVLQEHLDETKTKVDQLEIHANKLKAEHQERLQVVADQDNKIRRLKSVGDALRVQMDDLSNYIAGRKSDWDALHVEFARQRDANLSLRNAIDAKSESLAAKMHENTLLLAELDNQRANTARLGAELSGTAERLAQEAALRHELEAELTAKTNDGNALEIAHARVAEMSSSQQIMQEALDDKHQEIDKLKHSLNQLHAEHAEALAALKKQREIIQHMENEVRSKLKAITVIGRNAQRNKGKPASIHHLEVVRSKKKSGPRAESRAPQSNPMMVALNDKKNQKYRIEPGTMTIGRGKGNDICLHHHFISRHHAQISTDAEGSVIEDLGSKNGVLVNAEPISRRRLRDGDLVDIGEMQFKFIDAVDRTGDHKTH